MNYKKNILFFSGSRAEFGLSEKLIKILQNSKKFHFDLMIGGSHCIKSFGYTKNEIIKKNYKPKYLFKYNNDHSITSINNQTNYKVNSVLNKKNYDLLIIVGDRYELVSIAYNFFLRSIPIVHIHGGEITEGSMDDTIRHVLSKLSNIHFVANKDFKKRLLQLGEQKENIHIVGGLGIDSISNIKLFSKNELYNSLNLDLKKKIILISIHPTNIEKNKFKINLKIFFLFLSSIAKKKNYFFVFSGTNSDKNSKLIEPEILKFCRNNSKISIYKKNFGHETYTSLIKNAYVVIGNSSSGIIDTPYFKTPCINIGDRQRGRPISLNTINCEFNFQKLVSCFTKINSKKFNENLKKTKSHYGVPGASKKIYKYLHKNFDKITSKKTFIDI